jgi:hypothetical protein
MLSSSSLLVAITLVLLSVQSLQGAQISLQFTRTTQSNPWKLPSFAKGGRSIQPSTTVSSLLLQVRGGSDQWYGDDDYRKERPNRREYGYEEEKKVDDYYYGEQQDGRYYEDERRYDEYDDRGRGVRPRDGSSPSFSTGGMSSIIKNGDRKIGMILLSFGAFFTISGVFLFFHKTLLRLGNLLFIAGVPMTLGPGRTAGYFLQPRKARATGFLAFGIFLVFYGWPILGMALEIFGLLNLFGNMIPMAMIVLRQMPIVGGLFKAGSKRDNSRRDDDRYYNDDDRYRDDRYYGDDDQGGDDRYY